MAPLASAEQFTTYCGGLTLTGDETAQVEFLLDAVSGDVRTYCGWSISAENNVVWTVDGDGSTVLALPTLYLRAVDSVVSDGTTLDVAEDLEWSESGFLMNHNRWPRKLRSVVATVDHGYDPVPLVIVGVVCSMVSRLRPTAGGGAVSSVRIGDYSETRPNTNVLIGAVGPDMLGASPTEVAILDRYRITPRS